MSDDDPKLAEMFNVPVPIQQEVCEALMPVINNLGRQIKDQRGLDPRVTLALLRALTDAMQRTLTPQGRRLVWRMQRDQGSRLTVMGVPGGARLL